MRRVLYSMMFFMLWGDFNRCNDNSDENQRHQGRTQTNGIALKD